MSTLAQLKLTGQSAHQVFKGRATIIRCFLPGVFPLRSSLGPLGWPQWLIPWDPGSLQKISSVEHTADIGILIPQTCVHFYNTGTMRTKTVWQACNNSPTFFKYTLLLLVPGDVSFGSLLPIRKDPLASRPAVDYSPSFQAAAGQGTH